MINYFLASPQARRLAHFYNDLREQYIESAWDELLLVTRKGFWIYNIIRDDIAKDMEEDFWNSGDFIEEKYTDRYLLNALDHSFVKGKRVCLVDDTLSNGCNLFRYYCILKIKGARDIVPYVYAISTAFPRDRVKAEMLEIYKRIFKTESVYEAERVYAEFCDKMKCYRYMSQDNVSRFCLAEIELFQQVLCPMVVNLPMMVSRTGGSVMKDHFIMDDVQFQQLTKGDFNWKYVRNEYGDSSTEESSYCVAGNLQESIQCNYFHYEDQVVVGLKRSFLQNMVIKCKYNTDKYGRKYHIVFTPFAIVRSMEKRELIEVFKVLLGGTRYESILLNKLEDEPDSEFVWTAAMRSVVYVLSLYVGEKFREYLSSLGFTDSSYDQKIMRGNSEKSFIKALEDIDPIERVERLSDCVKLANRVDTMPGNAEALPLMTDVYEIIQWEMLDISERRRTDPKYVEGLDVEKIESVLAEKFSFQSQEFLALTVTSIILIMLEISAFGNHIVVMDQKVWRGFRHGENTKLLLPPSGRLCYICAEVLYTTLGEDKYKDKIEVFLQKMKKHLQEIHAFTRVYEEEYFDKYIHWFLEKREDAEFHIFGKKFLLDRLSKREEELQNYAVWAVENSADTMRGAENGNKSNNGVY